MYLSILVVFYHQHAKKVKKHLLTMIHLGKTHPHGMLCECERWCISCKPQKSRFSRSIYQLFCDRGTCTWEKSKFNLSAIVKAKQAHKESKEKLSQNILSQLKHQENEKRPLYGEVMKCEHICMHHLDTNT